LFWKSNEGIENCIENQSNFTDQNMECNDQVNNSDVLSNLETKLE